MVPGQFAPLTIGHNPRSTFSHYLPRLNREFYQADAVVFWTMPIHLRQQGWLTDLFHARFREVMLHAAVRENLLCPAYCLMPDHVHFVWMGLHPASDQRNGIKFLRAQLGPLLKPAKFQHQAHDHVLTTTERQHKAFGLACADYILLNPFKAELIEKPADWPHLGAIIPGYPLLQVFAEGYWPWFWKHYHGVRNPKAGNQVLPRRTIE